MKYLTNTIFYLMISLLVLIGLPVQSASLNLIPNSTEIYRNSGFFLDVKVDNLFEGLDEFDEFIAFGFNIEIAPNSSLIYQGFSLNPIFNDDSLFVAADIAGSLFPGVMNSSAFDTIILATLAFDTTNESGTVSVSIVSDLTNPIHQNDVGLFFALSEQQDLTTSIDISVIPTPSTAFLLLITLPLLRLRNPTCNK